MISSRFNDSSSLIVLLNNFKLGLSGTGITSKAIEVIGQH